MPKYGRGLNRELVAAVNKGVIREPFSIADVRDFIRQQGWNVPENYINCCLANGASSTHSFNYKKYFVSEDEGIYRVSDEYKGGLWK